MGDAPRSKQGIAAGVLALARNVGMALGVGLTGAIFNSYLGQANSNYSALLVRAFDASMLFISGAALLAAFITFARGDDRPGS